MGKHDRYPDEMVEYVRQHCGECTVAEMAERVTVLFGRPASYGQMRAFYKNHKHDEYEFCKLFIIIHKSPTST